MSRKFISAFTGTYNVHANEVARGMRNQGELSDQPQPSDKHLISSPNNFSGRLSNLSALITGRPMPNVPQTIKCLVHFLDDSEHIFEVDRSAKGEELMDAVFRHLELIEREYFALQFTEIFHHNGYNAQHHFNSNTMMNVDNNDERMNNYENKSNMPSEKNKTGTIVYNKWLDPAKKIRKQMRFCQHPFLLNFRVKFYVTEMSRLLEEYTRYHFYLQIRHDILTGRLVDTTNINNEQSQSSIMATLSSFVLQSELGDYCEEEHKPGYSNRFGFVPNQNDEFCNKVESLHRLHQGQTPADAELNYLEEAKNLELYGVDLHNAKDCEQNDILIGVCSSGLSVYKDHFVKINTFSWAKIVKISFKRRYFFIQLKHEGTERFDNLIGFNLCSYRACKSLWKSCVEQHTFFRLHTPKPVTKKFFFFFSLGSKFRYSGKTEFQTIVENRKRLIRTERIFIRNNARNATMPAALIAHANQNNNNAISNQKSIIINDAQKHIVNLKLSTIGATGSTTDNNTSAITRMITNGALNRFTRQNYQRNHSPLSSMESTSCSLSSSSASSLLGPSTAKIASKNQTLDTDKANCNNSVLSTKQLPNNRQQNINQKPLETCSSITSQSVLKNFSINTTSTSTTTSSSSSLESSFMPNDANTDDNDNTCMEVKINDKSTKQKQLKQAANNVDLFDNQIQLNTCDTININNSNLKNDESANNHSTVISIFGNSNNCSTTMETKIPTTFTSAYTPPALNSLPYIDSSSNSASEHFPTQLTNGAQIKNTIGEDLVEKDAVTNNDNKQSLTDAIDYDTPIRELIQKLYDGAAINSDMMNSSPDVDSPIHVVTVTMKPDSDGRFGFNVKGGHDQNCPVLVSRVAPNTPADNATPNKLHEGDQVLAINGIEVSGLKHEQVVQLIRSTRDIGSEAKLILSIRPNVYYQQCKTDDNDQRPTESPFHFSTQSQIEESLANVDSVANKDHICAKKDKSLDKLDLSMKLLHESLQEDMIIIQFDYLPRRNEDESNTIARYLENVPKNRYLDIAPYDSTRVVLNECNSGDYINASFVTMKVEASGVVNRYIATQGPLKRTTSDFWQMVWEQRSSMIVMVTPLIEDGRKKCFKYWPDEGETMIVNDLLDLKLESCEDRDAFLERRFKLIDPENKKTHYVTHLQYLAWPDQGVPDDDTDFLKLIFKVRELRKEDPDSPTIVHCSAGIGRTGVLILMETGICLIEANQPVYPLELVRLMRNQRAMLIQTSTQFRFVCEALYRVYKDKLIKPLDKYVNSEVKE